MSTEKTQTTSTTTNSVPPPPTPPPDIVRLRVDLSGQDYRRLRHVAIETASSVNEMACEAVRLLVRYYAEQGILAGTRMGGAR
jgi:hypothetical protein